MAIHCPFNTIYPQVSDKDEPNSLGTEEHLRSLLEPTLKETRFPLGTDVKVSRISIEDFDECESEEHNDCSTFATCDNTQVRQTRIDCTKRVFDFFSSLI